MEFGRFLKENAYDEYNRNSRKISFVIEVKDLKEWVLDKEKTMNDFTRRSDRVKAWAELVRAFKKKKVIKD